MSNFGTHFTKNTVFYDNNVPPTSIEFPDGNIKISAGEKVDDVSGVKKSIVYRFFPGIPPAPEPVYFWATTHSEWAPGEKVIVTGPSDGIITLTGTATGRIAIFQKEVDY